ncbi:substrate-binding domain-containing protein [Corynebacterium diphtheriae]|uniref:LacI family DNA-binding transcriptional regulator n=1 Tax=Corynebacterium diphtheriae TaxID=1717 RepID=UPI000A1F458E|nr:substrate-binding domain-containing protein [Corynebacterium diphtheriae]OSQ23176.1 LacI family transcriptional regulator [Corynebacterium diphtheriae]RKX02338.1 LacI family DNA-binding transcriptional regulator [Corynebacterium diphtheriae]UJL58765.1 substrate-binding domain-containing protein [Corynebacterium diphtheriae]CAB0591189.1 LacI family DNA-binding transcriptional regulator [Corynebacterium diphtheriae]CAB0637097.1 LacI family DNA-binding transcriptional regulator [Corynebacteriu
MSDISQPTVENAEKSPTWRRGRQSITLKDIAADTGLSISTVSRALARNPVIPESTRSIVEEAAARLNYRPNAQAKALRSQKSNTIGIVLPNIRNPYFNQLASAIQEAASLKGYCCMMANSAESPELINSALDILNSQQVDGIIVVPHIQSAQQIIAIAEQGTPIVAADRTVTHNAVPSVTSDPLPAMKEALRMLSLNPGASIGYIAGPQDTSTGRERLEAITSIKSELGIPSPDVYFGGYSSEAGFAGTHELLDRGVNCILTGDMMMTVGAIQAIYARGLRIGKDVALIGYDNTPAFLLQEQPITTIDQQVDDMGQRAFDMLYSHMNNGERVTSCVIPTTLALRASHSLAV